jgi:hypothetical protein
LQHAAPVLQQDVSAAGLQQSPFTKAVVGGTLPFPQQAAPAWQQGAPSVQHDTEADFAPFIGHLSPQHPPFPALCAAMSHLPSLQQPSPQHDLPLAIAWSL